MARDKTFFMKLIVEKPCPKYGDVIKIIKNEDHKMYLDMFAEYGKENHKWMKDIYENILEQEIVEKMVSWFLSEEIKQQWYITTIQYYLL